MQSSISSIHSNIFQLRKKSWTMNWRSRLFWCLETVTSCLAVNPDHSSHYIIKEYVLCILHILQMFCLRSLNSLYYSIWLNLFSDSRSYRGWIGRPAHAAVDESPESDRSASASEVASHSSDDREPSPRTDVFEWIASCLQLFFLVWLCTIDSRVVVAFTIRVSDKTLMIKSHSPFVDVPHELL